MDLPLEKVKGCKTCGEWMKIAATEQLDGSRPLVPMNRCSSGHTTNVLELHRFSWTFEVQRRIKKKLSPEVMKALVIDPARCVAETINPMLAKEGLPTITVGKEGRAVLLS